jgi:hypothetical protein
MAHRRHEITTDGLLGKPDFLTIATPVKSEWNLFQSVKSVVDLADKTNQTPEFALNHATN